MNHWLHHSSGELPKEDGDAEKELKSSDLKCIRIDMFSRSAACYFETFQNSSERRCVFIVATIDSQSVEGRKSRTLIGWQTCFRKLSNKINVVWYSVFLYNVPTFTVVHRR